MLGLAAIERDLSVSLAATGDNPGARAARERAARLYRQVGAVSAAERLGN